MDKKKELVIAEDVANHIIEEDDRKHKLAVYLNLGLSAKDAGVLAGYIETYSETKLYEVVKTSPRVLALRKHYADKMPAAYREDCMMDLALINATEKKILDQL